MSDLRTAAQQALEALEADCGGRCNAEHNPCWQREVAETLRAALAEDALQRLTDVSQEIEAALAEPVQEPVQHYASIPGTNVRVRLQAEPVEGEKT